MSTVVCPGSFDPVTVGHLDIIGRAAGLFDRVVVAVLANAAKQSMFSAQERLAMLGEVVESFGNVDVTTFDGLLVDLCRSQGARAIVKGVRSGGDLDYELAMASMNHAIGEIDTVFLPARPEHCFVSSSLVKEVVLLGGDVTRFVPSSVVPRLVRHTAKAATDS